MKASAVRILGYGALVICEVIRKVCTNIIEQENITDCLQSDISSLKY